MRKVYYTIPEQFQISIEKSQRGKTTAAKNNQTKKQKQKTDKKTQKTNKKQNQAYKAHNCYLMNIKYCCFKTSSF